MGKLLLTSIVVATIAFPVAAARELDPRRAVRNAVFWTLAFNCCYLFALRFIIPRLR